MSTSREGSKKFGEGQPASIRKANAVSYDPKGGSDTDEKSHGSRPSHVNNPEIKSYKA